MSGSARKRLGGDQSGSLPIYREMAAKAKPCPGNLPNLCHESCSKRSSAKACRSKQRCSNSKQRHTPVTTRKCGKPQQTVMWTASDHAQEEQTSPVARTRSREMPTTTLTASCTARRQQPSLHLPPSKRAASAAHRGVQLVSHRAWFYRRSIGPAAR